MATSNETGSRFDPQSPSFLLDLKNLQVAFSGAAPAVRNVSLTVRPGETVALVGESGSGKSVTSLAVMGLLEAEGGKVEAGEILLRTKTGAVVDMRTAGEKTRRSVRGRDVAMIFQEPMTSLNPVKRIGWQIEESLRIHTELNKEERYQKAIEMMKEVELPDPERLYRQYPHELSGGMRQRVMIAAAMICNPRILIADEPTTALDVTIQAQIVELLKRMNREKQTSILFISHDLSLVKQLCERVLVMKGGYIVETGLTQEVFAHPKEEYTQRLIAAIPKVKRNGK